MTIPTYKIVNTYGHYEARDSAGNIVCTGDTLTEIEDTIIELVREIANYFKAGEK